MERIRIISYLSPLPFLYLPPIFSTEPPLTLVHSLSFKAFSLVRFFYSCYFCSFILSLNDSLLGTFIFFYSQFFFLPSRIFFSLYLLLFYYCLFCILILSKFPYLLYIYYKIKIICNQIFVYDVFLLSLYL